jgi:hypothetical protein
LVIAFTDLRPAYAIATLLSYLEDPLKHEPNTPALAMSGSTQLNGFKLEFNPLI